MLILMRRNYQAAQFEFYVAANVAQAIPGPTEEEVKRINKQIYYTEASGVLLSGLGILLLLVEVWFLLLQ